FSLDEVKLLSPSQVSPRFALIPTVVKAIVKDDLRVKSDGAKKRKAKEVKEEQVTGSFKRMEARLGAMMIVRLHQVQRKMRLSLYLRSEGFTENDGWDHVSFWDIDNSAIKIAANPVFHERTKRLEIDLHFVREIFLKGVVKTVKVDSANQIADVFTKGLDKIQHKNFLKKLGMYDIYHVEMKGGC
ncbi:hypothetical protein Tco_1379782, partial [Tanacetum coccineum]